MNWETNEEIMQELAKRVKKIRKIRKLTQKQLAIRSNISYGSIKRFEQSGEISLKGLLQVAEVLNVKDEIKSLFSGNYYNDIGEVIS